MTFQHVKNYKILSKIGEGSFSEVFKVQSVKHGDVFAAKWLKKIYKDELDILSCVELAVLKNINLHPNVMEILDVISDPLPGHVILIFELMDMTLHEYLKTRKRCPSELKARVLLHQLVCGLHHLHSNGIFHRDLKPENILLKFQMKHRHGIRPIELLKIADMGSACNSCKSPPHTAYISTRWYRSPECLLTHGYYGPKMDIWALGCIYYEMLTLLPLFPGENELDQLYRIHAILGTPSISMLSRFKNMNDIFIFPKRKPISLYNLLPAVSEDGINVLSKCLIYLPDFRADIRHLAKHSYFRDLRASTEFHSTPHLVTPTVKKNPATTTNRIMPLKLCTNSNVSKVNAKLKSVTSRSLDARFLSFTVDSMFRQKERMWGMTPGEAKTALMKTTTIAHMKRVN